MRMVMTPLLPGTLVAGALDLDVGVLVPLAAISVRTTVLAPLARPGRQIAVLVLDLESSTALTTTF